MSIKPVAWKRAKTFNESPEYYGKEKLWKDDVPLYAIPETHRIVPVSLLNRLLSEWQETSAFREAKAIIDNK